MGGGPTQRRQTSLILPIDSVEITGSTQKPSKSDSTVIGLLPMASFERRKPEIQSSSPLYQNDDEIAQIKDTPDSVTKKLPLRRITTMQPKVGEMLGIRSALAHKHEPDQITDKKQQRTVCFDESRNDESGQNQLCNQMISETFSDEDVTPKFSTAQKGDAL